MAEGVGFEPTRLSVTSANYVVKIVRMALKDALVSELVDRNVAVGIKRVKHRGEVNERRPFTIPELKKILGKVALAAEAREAAIALRDEAKWPT